MATSLRVTSQRVTGVDGKEYVSDRATIWRWRNAPYGKATSRPHGLDLCDILRTPTGDPGP
ncbi:MAG: hypothetical protein QM757_34140 [Paludibaculum sp.]